MLTVAMITCNRLEQYKQAIISCETHIKGEWELVVVDNHSSDGTKEWTIEYFKERSHILNYIYLEKNCGVAGARNIAYQNARGEVVYFLDDDAVIEGTEDCLNQAYQYMQNNKQLALMGTEIFDHKINDLLVEIPQKKEELVTGTIMRGFVGASHFVNKEKLGDIELYPEFIFYGGEELYLSFKSYERWGMCCYYKEFTVHHYPSSKTRLSKEEMQISRFSNAYKIRKALFPKQYNPLLRVFYYINVFKAFRFDFKSIAECNKRTKFTPEAIDKISIETVKKLVNLFGIVKVFK